MLRIDALAAFNDNYIWLLQDEQSKQCAVVDPGDAAPVKNWLAAHPDWQLTTILITHHHGDHTGGILELKQHSAAQVLGPSLEKIPGIDQTLEDQQIIDVLGVPFEVFHVPGHTLGHIVYHSSEQALLFSGDTLFAAGCGRLFEGTPAQMYQSLQRLARLPSKTRLYCTHEYTLSNLRFALAVEPDNKLINSRYYAVQTLLENNQASLPSSIELELQTNPFLRCEAAEVIQQVLQADDQSTPDPLEVFTRLRRWKDSF